METIKKIHREITLLSNEDSFLVFDRTKEVFDYPVHYHPEMELNYISNGKGIHRVIGDSLEQIEDVELVLVGPNLYHGWLQNNCPPKTMHEITIHFHNDLLDRDLMNRRVMKPIKNLFELSVHGILFSKETTLQIAPRLAAVSKLEGMDYFLEFLSILNILSNSENQRLLSTATVHHKNLENGDKIKFLYEYIQKNYAKKISLSEVAELLNMSNVSFNRFIKKRTNKTFVEYLNDVRIGFASRWLIEKDLGISEIAFLCGFNSIANFNRVFRKSKGRTPTEYRNDYSGIRRGF